VSSYKWLLAFKLEVVLLSPNRVLMCPSIPRICDRKMMDLEYLKRIIESEIITALI
jgi:hypothetical protein